MNPASVRSRCLAASGGVAGARGGYPVTVACWRPNLLTELATMRRSIPLALLALSVPLISHAADQTIRGSKFLVKNPGSPSARRIVVRAKETDSSDTIVGNPVAKGATLTLSAYGASSTTQTFALPAANSPSTGKPFWSGDAVRGFTYKDSRGENGPVKIVEVKKSKHASFTIKIVVDAK